MSDELLSQFKDSITELMDTSTTSNISEDHPKLTKFLSILEQILLFGYKPKKWFHPPTLWEYIETTLSKTNTPGTRSLLDTVLNVTEKSPEIRVQVYLRMSLMQQTLGQHLNDLTMDKEYLKDYYESDAIVFDVDKTATIVGMVSGLTRLEFNLFVKESPTTILPDLSFLRPESLTALSKKISFVMSKPTETVPLSDYEALQKKLSQVEMELEYEKKQKLMFQVELIAVKLQRDKDMYALKQKIAQIQSHHPFQ